MYNCRGTKNTPAPLPERTKVQEALSKACNAPEARVNDGTTQLEDVNRALRVLLRQRREDRTDLAETVSLNINGLVLPYVEKLKAGPLDARQRIYVEIVESSLHDIVSPFAHRLSLRHASLTPAEIQISHLIRNGRTTKEIAGLLNLSYRTIESHRSRIRTKLGIRNKRTGLRSYLASV